MPSPQQKPQNSNETPEKRQRKHVVLKILAAALIVLVVVLIAVRAYLPIWITDYANKTLDNIPGYSGSITDVDLALYRGAYVIKSLKIFKDGKDIPVPFVDIRNIDLSLQWGALFRGEIVGDVTLDNPKLNFATGKSGTTSQTGTTTDWTVPIKKLM